MGKNSVETMWGNFLQTLDKNDRGNKSYTAWSFGGGAEMARELADLVMTDDKTATTSLHLFYEIEEEPLPRVGDLNVITDWEGEAKAITETIDVQVIPFKNVNAEFAAKEGEGDKSLEYWRKVHIDFFTNELFELGKEFSEEMLVVCEEFKVIFPH